MNKDSVRLPLSKQKIEVHDKKQACPFCERLVSKFAEHIEVHRSEPTVAQMQNLTTNGFKERKSRIADMRKRGAFLHNMKVLAKETEFLLSKGNPVRNNEPLWGGLPMLSGLPGLFYQANHAKSYKEML